MTEIKYQTGYKRFLAALIDALVFLPVLLLDEFIRGSNSIGLVTLTTSFVALSTVVYSVLMHAKYGQTVGKMVMKIKVVDISQSQPITFKQALLRDSIMIAIIIAGLIYFLFEWSNATEDKILIENFLDFNDGASLFWAILELVTMLTNAKRRALHDFIAKTVVVRSR